MDEVEEAFLSDMRRINKKRLEQLPKRLNAIVSDLPKELTEDNLSVLRGTIQLPSSKEYRKVMTKLVRTSMYSGLARADKELKDLRQYYKPYEVTFAGDIYTSTVYENSSTLINPEVESYLTEYGLSITAITEETVVRRLVDKIAELANKGVEPANMVTALMETAGAWMSESHARTIARTENSKMYNAGRLRRYFDEDNKGFVVALQYDAIVDTRTTPLCRHLDGMIVSVDRIDIINKYSPPNHFQCRSVWLPVTKFEEWTDTWDNSEEPQKGFEWNPMEDIK